MAADSERRRAPRTAPTPAAPQVAPAVPHQDAPGELAVAVPGVAVDLRRRSSVSDPLGGTAASADVSAALERRRGRGRPIEPAVAESMGSAMDADFSGVRVHDDAEADRIARSVQATAFTAGSDIYFTRGTYAPGTPKGDHLLGHELAHTTQQHAPSAGSGPVIGRADDPAEAAADAMASRAVARLQRQAARVGGPTDEVTNEAGAEPAAASASGRPTPRAAEGAAAGPDALRRQTALMGTTTIRRWNPFKKVFGRKKKKSKGKGTPVPVGVAPVSVGSVAAAPTTPAPTPPPAWTSASTSTNPTAASSGPKVGANRTTPPQAPDANLPAPTVAPVQQPTDPVQQPTGPVQQPTDPVQQPTGPAPESSDSGTGSATSTNAPQAQASGPQAQTDAQTDVPTEEVAQEAAEDATKSPKQLLEEAFDPQTAPSSNTEAKARMDALRPLISTFDGATKKTIAADADLMAKGRAHLGDLYYMSLLAAVDMYRQRTTTQGQKVNHHLSGAEADQFITTNVNDYPHIKPFITEASAAGKKGEGYVATVSPEDWAIVYAAQNPDATASSEARVNAFIGNKNEDRPAMLHADRGTPSTAIHESMHRYSVLNVLRTFGSGLNEGITEFFTRMLTTKNATPTKDGGPERDNYQKNVTFVRAMLRVLGADQESQETVLAEIYFKGEVAKLEQKFKDSWKAADATLEQAELDSKWSDLKAALSAQDWPTATGLLPPA
ncbi:DUF4157 domain-containing protein [Actinotalea sp. M2MS4P-6]|uniref:eCIS core domain-containing protein n=1 Tax=Actinotalea sp. M2MS4P-6 TaxID=2983762 RepID=UPI0021E4E2A0|nr:DUF4157 domain-containing protein [Actinotalea sp. M2MS4P-6]MCV2395226.1 DUF4157 domain-containing protein [Actinotalea sp. M2MS4P-6]